MKRDQLSQLSMMNFTFKNVGGGVISDRQGSVGSRGVNPIKRMSRIRSETDCLDDKITVHTFNFHNLTNPVVYLADALH